MAPRKVKVDALSAWYSLALDATNMPERNLTATHLMTAVEGSKMAETELRAGSAELEAKGSTFYPFFTNAIFAGLVPPFSNFFYAILRHYRLSAVHLNPNSALLLLIFAYYCEAHVGVM